MARLLAAVAHTLVGGLGRAVTRQMANLAAVVALLSLRAVTAHVAEAAARVAGSLPTTTVATLAAAVATAVATAAVAAAALSAVPSNVASLTALVAFLATAGTTADRGTSILGALTADVTNTTATVARLLGLRRRALAAQVTLLTAVVAGGVSLAGAFSGTVRRIATVVAATATGTSSWSLVIHFLLESGVYGNLLGTQTVYLAKMVFRKSLPRTSERAN